MPKTLEAIEQFLVFQWNALLLFGAVLLLGLVAGYIVAKNPWVPRITGYLLAGVVLGESGAQWLSGDVLKVAAMFADIALALVVYQLGRYVDIGWLRYEKWLLATVASASALCFLFVWLGLEAAGMPRSLAMLAGVFSIGTAPAVVMVVVRDLNAEGQVTRRLAAMTALNNLVTLLAGYVALPLIATDVHVPLKTVLLSMLYSVLGAFILAYLTYWLLMPLARLLGRERTRQFVLVIAIITLTIGVAHALQLPVLLTMLIFAILSKNLDLQYDLMELEFGVASELFVLMLFVTLGATMRVANLFEVVTAVAILVAARCLAMTGAIFAFARLARLRWSQATALSLGSLPMAEASLGFAQIAVLYPQAAAAIVPLFAGALVVLELIGPIATQFALIKSGESGRE